MKIGEKKMNNGKKVKYIWAITLVIAGLLITSIASIPATETEITSTDYFCVETSKVMSEKYVETFAFLDDSYIIYDTEDDDYHPTFAGDLSGRFFAGFEAYLDSGADYFPWFWYSLDEGATWDEGGYFGEAAQAEYPDADSNANAFYATFGAPPANTAQVWAVEATLPDMGASVWDWGQYNLYDFRHNSISCYTRTEEAWNWGGMALVGFYGYQGSNIEGCPYILYPNEPSSGVIGWQSGQSNCVHADFAIDEATEMSYSVYDKDNNNKLRLRKDDFSRFVTDPGFPVHPSVWSKDIGDGSVNLMNMSIDAHDDVVIVVTEAEGDIICLYSTNGMSSYDTSTVVTGAAYPEVKFCADGFTAICTYVVDGEIFVKTSEDDGATWSDEELVADSQVTDGYGSHDLGRDPEGMSSIWADTRGEDIDIYYAHAADGGDFPILEVTIESGFGIGVSATIANTGTGPATNVNWTMTVTGGILGFINKTATGTIASLAAGAEETVKSGLLLGLGAIDIIATAECDEDSSDQDTGSGTQLIIFTKVN